MSQSLKSKIARAVPAARLILGALFVASGYLKLIYPAEEFAAAIEAYEILPSSTVFPLAVTLPWLELVLGFFLSAGYLTRFSVAGIGAMIVMFLGAISLSYLKGVELAQCGCFVSGVSLTPAQDFILDLTLLAFAAFIWRYDQKILSLDRWLQKTA